MTDRLHLVGDEQRHREDKEGSDLEHFLHAFFSVLKKLPPSQPPARTNFEELMLRVNAFEAAYFVPLEFMVQVLCAAHGRARLKRALQWLGPQGSSADDARIWAYVETIKRCAKVDTKSACEWLARIGVPIEKETRGGRATNILQNAEALRHRYLRMAKDTASDRRHTGELPDKELAEGGETVRRLDEAEAEAFSGSPLLYEHELHARTRLGAMGP